MVRVEAICVALIICFSGFLACYSAPKPAFAARKEDIPFIKCQVCEKIASQLYHQVKKKESQISQKKISEFQIIEICENVCNLKKEEGDWIFKIDIVEKGDALELVEQEFEGECRSECKTIERACQEIMEYSDTDVAEFLYENKHQMDLLYNYLCKKVSGACLTEPPPVSKDRVPGEPFQPKSPKEADMEKILRSMQDMPGAPSMKMYSKDDLLRGNFGDEDEDEDEDDRFSSKLGEIIREYPKEDWKKWFVKKIRESSAVVRKQASTVSRRVYEWWRRKVVSKRSAKMEL